MTITLRTTAPHLDGQVRVLGVSWIEWDRAAVCLDCEAIHTIDRDGCPRCGSRSVGLIATWLQERRRGR